MVYLRPQSIPHNPSSGGNVSAKDTAIIWSYLLTVVFY